MLPSTIQQWQTCQDGLEHLTQVEAPMPTPGPGEVLVKIQAVALNYRDTEVSMGLYTHHRSVDAGRPEPLVPCSDMCGIIVAVGPAAEEDKALPAWSVGDRVLSAFAYKHLTGSFQEHHMASGLGLPLPGVLQTYRVFPAEGLLAAPAYLADTEACCLPVAAVTAWMAVNGLRPLGQPGGAGEVVLLQGTGGVSISGLQIAHASGATTIVTSSSDEKLEKAKALGADYTINYRTTPDWASAVLKVTNGHGADIIFENGGASTTRQSFDAVAFGGLINCIGYLGGKTDSPDADRTTINVLALRRNMTLRGLINGPRDRYQDMLKFYAQHEIHPVVDRLFAFADGKKALQYLFSGGHFGKVVIKVAPDASEKK